MMSVLNRLGVSCALGAVVCGVLAGSAVAGDGGPIDGGFGYQGVLNDGGVPADGVFDLRFQLFDGNGVAVSSVYESLGVVVEDGLFRERMPWDVSLFDGQRLFLQVEVQVDGGGYVALSPRTELTAVPYASYSVRAGSAASADVAEMALVAETSLDSHVFRIANNLYAGDTNERLLINPDLSGGEFLNNSILQINTEVFGNAGVLVNSVNNFAIPFYGFGQNGTLTGYIEQNPSNGLINTWNLGAPAPSLSVSFATVSTPADVVIGQSLEVDGEINQDYGDGNHFGAAPVAYGTFNVDGSKIAGTPNISAVWNQPGLRYDVTLEGESFLFSEYTVMVTPVGSFPPVIPMTTSNGGNLLVYLYTVGSLRTQGQFQVVIYDALER